MEESSMEDSSLTVVQGDNTIAFAYIREMKSKKRRFFVLKAVPKASPWDADSSKTLPHNYFLYAYKNKKYYEKGEAKRIYDVSNVMFLSRCTNKANKTVLGVCFQDDALYLKFESEDELNRWYFHLNEIYSSTRNSLWPELRHCFSVTLKSKDLALTGSKLRPGQADLSGQYRFCMTDSTVLLVKDDLQNPALSLPFPCIRSCVHSKTSNFFQLCLGRLSPLGEGILHFEAEQNSMLKELIETLVARLSEGSSRDADCVKIRKHRRHSKDTNSSSYYGDSLQRPLSTHSSVQRSCSKCDTKFATADAKACPQCEAVFKCENYCLMSSGPSTLHNRSQNSSMSLSTNSEFASHDSAHGSAAPQHPSAAGGSEVSDEEARLARVSTWRYESVDSDAPCSAVGEVGADSVPALGARANSIGSRPVRRTGSYLSTSTSCQAGHQCGHRDSRQMPVEVSFQRPRTISDASKHHLFSLASRGFRPRARSHGNRFLTTCAHCAAQQLQQDERPSSVGQASCTELRSLGETADQDDPYVLMAPAPRAQAPAAEEDPYWRPPGNLDSIVDPRPQSAASASAAVACDDYVLMDSAAAN